MMDKDKLAEMLERHRVWLHGQDGVPADLHHADLRGADLRYADLCAADLRGADLRCADLRCADLRFADLCGADLRGADLDYSCWPLWCFSLSVRIDAKIAAQLLYHALRAMDSVDDPEVRAVRNNPANIELANRFHRVEECGRLREV